MNGREKVYPFNKSPLTREQYLKLVEEGHSWVKHPKVRSDDRRGGDRRSPRAPRRGVSESS